MFLKSNTRKKNTNYLNTKNTFTGYIFGEISRNYYSDFQRKNDVFNKNILFINRDPDFYFESLKITVLESYKITLFKDLIGIIIEAKVAENGLFSLFRDFEL